jgi:hypothetical protein
VERVELREGWETSGMKHVLRLNAYGRAVIAVLLAIMISYAYLISPLPMVWEQEDEPFVYSLTWHSGLVFLIILTLSYLLIWSVSRKR